ncbi:MAG: AAA family ATPase [Cyanobacteria bacterium P01_A01_bin.84]
MVRASIPTLIEEMLKPDFYPHPVNKNIQLVQTHISYILLTGDYAYKVKKPVNFGFLDFSTLEKRSHFCQEELRLNKRGAAQLYISVLPINRNDEQYQLGDATEPVEYVLKMHQFPESGLLSTMLERGQLNESHISELGKVVARYHSETETNDYIRSFGEVDRVRRSIDENYKLTTKYIGKAQTEAQYKKTKAYTDKFFNEHPQLFVNRIANNLIRECHGDLHLRNICIWREQILLFDCIEFNETFRFVDVMYDVAFTVMDLEARKRRDLANIFLNTYLEQTGDWEGLQLLPLYLSRQAYVRAKVNSFLLDDSEISINIKEESKRIAANYYKQAADYTQPQQGKLFLMSGVSGSGKSTVARYLSQKLGAIQIRSDAVRKHLAKVPLLEPGGDELYTDEMSSKTYSRLLELGIMLTTQGFTVILDAKYDKQSLRAHAIAAAKQHQIPLKIIQCTAPPDILRDRLNRRSGDITDAKADLLSSQLQNTEPFSDEEKSYLKILDTTEPQEAQLTEVIYQ